MAEQLTQGNCCFKFQLSLLTRLLTVDTNPMAAGRISFDDLDSQLFENRSNFTHGPLSFVFPDQRRLICLRLCGESKRAKKSTGGSLTKTR